MAENSDERRRPVPAGGDEAQRQRALQRLFERSLRKVREAIARREAWKRQRAATGDADDAGDG
jgi:hypothetical protein